jgi:TfoX/Sxy family transcriptional regulator of competence genes
VAYDEELAERVRAVLSESACFSQRKMFGGIGFMLSGNMAAGVIDDDVIVRLGPEEAERALDEPGVRMFDKTGRPMMGWILIGPEATSSDESLRSWVERGGAFASSLAPK